MNKWYFDAELLPTAAFNRDTGIDLDGNWDSASLDLPDWWAQTLTPQDLATRLDGLLERADSWGPDLDLWGPEAGNQIYLYRSGNCIESVLVRFDVRDADTGFVSEICDLAGELSCKFLALAPRMVLEPNPDEIHTAIQESGAAYAAVVAAERPAKTAGASARTVS